MHAHIKKAFPFLLLLLTLTSCGKAGKAPNLPVDFATPSFVLSFDPTLERNDLAAQSSSDYSFYNITSNSPELKDFGGLTIYDIDFNRELILGYANDILYICDLDGNSKFPVGPDTHTGGNRYTSESISLRPNSYDYCVVNETGEIFLWHYNTYTFESLGAVPLPQNPTKWPFQNCVWRNENEFAVIDKAGLSLVNVEEKSITHWIDLDSFPTLDSYNLKHFDFWGENQLVYILDDSLLTATIADDGTLSDEIVLCKQFVGRCAFAVSPDGQAIVFLTERIKNALFNPHYLVIELYYNEKTTTLLTTKGTTHFPPQLFW